LNDVLRVLASGEHVRTSEFCCQFGRKIRVTAPRPIGERGEALVIVSRNRDAGLNVMFHDHSLPFFVTVVRFEGDAKPYEALTGCGLNGSRNRFVECLIVSGNPELSAQWRGARGYMPAICLPAWCRSLRYVAKLNMITVSYVLLAKSQTWLARPFLAEQGNIH
jgi:hypothetical protein